MRNRSRSWSILVPLMAASLLFPPFVAVHAQAPPAATNKAASKTSDKDKKTAEKSKWTPTRTADGQPDISGYWTSLSFTPMERPKQYGNREFLTDKEMAEVFKAGVQHTYEFTFANSAETPVYDATVYALGAWQNGVQPNPRTSLVVDPPDGQIPALTPEAMKARKTMAMKRGASEGDEGGGGNADSAQDLPLGVQCLTFGGPPILPRPYDSDFFIMQGAGYVLIEGEWDSEPRIISLDGAPHLGQNMHEWHGDSRGHWEGNTLVVETTNFRTGATFQNADAKSLKMTEYFTRTGPKTVEYKFTVNDPATWTKPWTAIIPLSSVQGPLFEYACNEGNNGLINTLAGARATEKAQQEKKQAPPEDNPISQKR